MSLVLDAAKPYKSGGTLLDVGANIGFMLELAQERGFKATGVEPSPAANRYAHNKLHLNMIEGYFPPPELDNQYFDLITLNHVLEHVPDPINFLGEIKRHLNPDGVAIIMSPCYTSLMASILGRKWGGYQPTQHIWQFTPETAAQLAGRAGLQVLQHYKSSLGHYVGSNTLINQAKEVAKIGLAKIGAFLGIGDQIVVIVKNQ
jgi:2-polyprenyl-3-methyl-5-hydroxy-6-metoxy-1,4-benzoquinol methylase